MADFKLSSWNVNSLKIRENQVIDFLLKENPDVLFLQEIKQETAAVNIENFKEIGFNVLAFGQKTYNGLAIISKDKLVNPIFNNPLFVDHQSRIISVNYKNLKLINVYVPNGSEIPSDKFTYKLNWLEHLYLYLKQLIDNKEKIIIAGDFNIAPKDEDVYSPEAWQGKILCSEQERNALEKILSLGLLDIFRLHNHSKEYSWWDYRFQSFNRNNGIRIDLILSNLQKSISAEIHKSYRQNDRPSDHAPISAIFDMDEFTK